MGEAIAFSLDPDERRIVNYAIEHGRINASDALRILSTTYWHTAKGKLKRLVDRGVLDFISKKHRDPNSHYVIRRPVAKEVVRRDSSGTRQRRGKRGSAAGREK